jgi:hypothetical protein
MTEKLQSIEAFKNIKTPLKKIGNKYFFDINSRYFQEDIVYNLHYIIKTAKKYLVDASTMNLVYNKLNRLLNENSKNY